MNTKLGSSFNRKFFFADHDSSIASGVQIIEVNNDPSSSIIEGETIELVIPEGGDVRNIVTVETSQVPEIRQ